MDRQVEAYDGLNLADGSLEWFTDARGYVVFEGSNALRFIRRTVCSLANNPKTRTRQAAEDARLISAAPDLLRAIRALMAQILRTHISGDVQCEVEAAIAKATGLHGTFYGERAEHEK